MIFRLLFLQIISFLFLCLLSSCTTKLCNEEFDARPLSISEAKEIGYDFRATGNEPSWQVLIIKDRIEFYTPLHELKNKIFCLVDESGSKDEIKHSIFGKSNLSTIEVNILKEKCNDSMSGEEFNFKVEIVVDKQIYQGCGEYLKTLR